jgi:predicted molibdopterin-dependent oxidoreductase YjgC
MALGVLSVVVNSVLATGNVGHSGSGANIFRGHTNVQGATDLGQATEATARDRKITARHNVISDAPMHLF